MGYILDGIVILIILYAIISSSKRGFVRTAIEVVGFIAAFLIAFTVSSQLANVTYAKIIEPSIINTAEAAVTEGTQNAADAIWSAIPKIVKENGFLQVSKDEFYNSVSGNTSNNITELAQNATQAILKPVISKLLSMIYSTVIIIVLLFVVKILAKYINKLFSFSIVGDLNRTLGGIVGFVKGIVFAFVFCCVITLIVSLTKNGFLIFTSSAINSSHIFSFLAGFSPFI